jgi:phage tail-like protein
MAQHRDRPYLQFNFLVDLGTGDTASVDAGFEECGPFSAWLDLVEYRNGNDKENGVRKLTGLARYEDVTFRRGVIGSLSLWAWLEQVRNGDQGALRNVTVSLQNEAHDAVAMTWKLLRARPVRWTVDPLSARRSEIAVEELVLAYESLEVQ